MLSSSIRVSDSEIEGSGLFANCFIPEGEVLYRFEGVPAHQYELVYLSQADRNEFMTYACQIGDDEFCFKQGDIRFINHCCDPSGWWTDYGVLTARRDIQPGEEITYDYSTSDIQLHYRMDCRCGKADCRGVVTEKDFLEPAFQQKYGRRFPAHVLAALARIEAGEPDPRVCDESGIPAEVVTLVGEIVARAADFQRLYGQGYVFEMIRHAVLFAQSGGRGPVVVPQDQRRYDDNYIFLAVRQLVLRMVRAGLSAPAGTSPQTP